MASSSTGNLLSNIAPPSALPSFIASPVQIASSSSTANDDKINSQIDYSSDVQTKQPQDNHQIQHPAGPSKSETTSEQLSRSSSQDSNQFFDAGLVGSNLFSWVKTNVVNSNVLSKVAEKAKSSVNTMITTLDPQMREFICKCNFASFCIPITFFLLVLFLLTNYYYHFLLIIVHQIAR